MKPEDKVCTLEQAKKLKVLGVIVEAEKYWVEGRLGRLWLATEGEIRNKCGMYEYSLYRAYDVAELLVILPSKIVIRVFDYRLKTKKGANGYRTNYKCQARGNCRLGFELRPLFDCFAHSLADQIIFILEGKHLNVHELNGDSE